MNGHSGKGYLFSAFERETSKTRSPPPLSAGPTLQRADLSVSVPCPTDTRLSLPRCYEEKHRATRKAALGIIVIVKVSLYPSQSQACTALNSGSPLLLLERSSWKEAGMC